MVFQAIDVSVDFFSISLFIIIFSSFRFQHFREVGKTPRSGEVAFSFFIQDQQDVGQIPFSPFRFHSVGAVGRIIGFVVAFSPATTFQLSAVPVRPCSFQ